MIEVTKSFSKREELLPLTVEILDGVFLVFLNNNNKKRCWYFLFYSFCISDFSAPLISLLSRITSRSDKYKNILSFVVEAEILMFPKCVTLKMPLNFEVSWQFCEYWQWYRKYLYSFLLLYIHFAIRFWHLSAYSFH